jgi:tripartite-type tricarboxylate transporter receptor subunit TctC
MRGIRVLGLAAVLLPLLAWGEPAIAQAYPAKAVTMVVPFPPGGRTDLTARAVAQFLKNELGQPVVILNKPGASGVLGAKEVAGAAPDGYTLGFFSTGFLTTQYTVPTPTSVKEYELIALMNYDPAAVAASAAKGWKTLAEVVAAGKAKPRALRVGINPGSSAHIFAAAFCNAAGIEATYVPFKGGSERAAALAGGHIDIDFDIVAPMKAMRDAGKLRVLGVASEQRVDLYRDLPTMREEGGRSRDPLPARRIRPEGIAPATPDARGQSLERVARQREFVDQMATQLLGVRYMNRAEFSRFFAEQDAQFLSLIQKLGLLVSPPK